MMRYLQLESCCYRNKTYRFINTADGGQARQRRQRLRSQTRHTATFREPQRHEERQPSQDNNKHLW